MQNFSEAQGVQAGCHRTDVCLNHQCQHSGQCLDLWWTYKCHCPDGFAGAYCEKQVMATFEADLFSALKFKSASGGITSFSFQFSADTESLGGILAYTDKGVRNCLT